MNFPDRSFQLVEQHAGHEQCHSVAPDFCGVFLLWLRNRIWKKVKQGSSASGQSKHVRLTRATTVETLSVVVVFQNFRFIFFFYGLRGFRALSTCCLFLTGHSVHIQCDQCALESLLKRIQSLLLESFKLITDPVVSECRVQVYVCLESWIN